MSNIPEKPTVASAGYGQVNNPKTERARTIETISKRMSVNKKYINFFGFHGGGGGKSGLPNGWGLITQCFDHKDEYALGELTPRIGWSGIRICTSMAYKNEEKRLAAGEKTGGIIDDGLYLVFTSEESINSLLDKLQEAKKLLRQNIAAAEAEERRRTHEEYLAKFGGKVINLQEWAQAHKKRAIPQT